MQSGLLECVLLFFSHSVVSSSLWPMDCSTPGFLVHHYLLEFAQTHVCWAGYAIQPSYSSIIVSCPQSFPASGSFQMGQLFTLGSQSIGASASASVLPMNSQDWFPLGLTGLISLQSKGLKSLLQYHSSKASILQHSVSYSPTLTSIHDPWKNLSLD